MPVTFLTNFTISLGLYTFHWLVKRLQLGRAAELGCAEFDYISLSGFQIILKYDSANYRKLRVEPGLHPTISPRTPPHPNLSLHILAFLNLVFLSQTNGNLLHCITIFVNYMSFI